MGSERERERDLDCVVLEGRVIKGWLVRDVHTVYEISIWALHMISDQF